MEENWRNGSYVSKYEIKGEEKEKTEINTEKDKEQ